MIKLEVTVLMAVYNGGRYLKSSIESILTQTFRDFELLIINDCSTDRSVKTIESFHDDRIKIHNNERNLGQTKSLNAGLKIASGEYIARIDADDIALPQWLEVQVNHIKDYPDVSVVSCFVFAIDEHNKIKKLYKPPLNREDIILRSLIASPINHVGSILKKSDIMEKGGYDERYVTAADYDLWGRLHRDDFKITTTTKILMAIREHAQSLSSTERGKRELDEITEIANKNINKFIKIKFSEAEVKLFCRGNYDEGNLTAAEFSEAIEVTKSVYTHLDPSLGVKNRKIVQWTQKRCKTLYLKRIFSIINRKDYNAARSLSLAAIKEFGPLNIFIMFLGASLFGGVVLNFIPEIYNSILRRKARLQLGTQLNIGMFN